VELVALCGCGDINVSKLYSLCTAHSYCRQFAKVLNKISNIKFMLELKQYLYKPWEIQWVKVAIFQGNRHMNLFKLSALCTCRLYHHYVFLVLMPVTGQAEPSAIVRPAAISQWTTACRVVAQSVNQQRHHVPYISLSLIKHHTVRLHERLEVWFRTLFILGVKWGKIKLQGQGALSPGMTHRYQNCRGLGEPQNREGHFIEMSHAQTESNPSSSVAQYIAW